MANGVVAGNAFLDWDFYVYELIEETVDVLEIGIDSSPIIAGYYVLAFNPNDENAREYVVENSMEVLHKTSERVLSTARGETLSSPIMALLYQ